VGEADRVAAGLAPRRGEGRSSGLAVLALLLAIGAVALAGRGPALERGAAPAPGEAPLVAAFPPGSSLGTHPDLKVMGIEPAATHTPLCTEDRTATMTASFAERVEDGVAVDLARWEATPAGGQAGYASFWSKCFHSGAAVRIRSDDGGKVLAVYDPATGLEFP